MPLKPKHPCNYPGCPRLTDRRYCPPHEKLTQKQYDKIRETAVARGYDTRWQKVRGSKMARSPLCERCEEAGRVEPAVLVHHVDRNPRNNHEGNLISLCAECHDREHAADRFRPRQGTKNASEPRASMK